MSKSRASKMNGYSALIGKKKPEKCIYDKKSLNGSAKPIQAITNKSTLIKSYLEVDVNE